MTTVEDVALHSYAVRCDTNSTDACHLEVMFMVHKATDVEALLPGRGWIGSRNKRTCPGCLCTPTEGSIMAYYGQRAITRNTTKGEPRHAVPALSRLGGAMDAECGVIGAIEIGPWDPDDPTNCRKCAKFIAGRVPIPRAEPVLVPVPDVVEAPVQLQLAFDAAA